MYGEALHGYDVSLAEGSYTVVVRIIMDDPKRVGNFLLIKKGLEF